MAKRITEEDKIQINELYLRIGTYAGVAKEMGIGAATVKKYIIPDYVSKEQIAIKHFGLEDLPEFDTSCFKGVDNYGELCVYNEDEEADIKELWNEILV